MTIGNKFFIYSLGILILFGLVAACSSSTVTPVPTETDLGNDLLQPTLVPTDAPPTPAPRPALDVARINIRTVDGDAEFFNNGTGEKFVPRGFNYIHFLPTERESYEDRVMTVNYYDPARVREAFRHMSSAGYNTVRIFFDICSFGVFCFAKEDGEGLNPGYLDNIVDLMQIAGEEGIYIIFTANSIPEGVGYSAYFDSLFEANPAGFEDWRNADWLHTAGV